MANNITDNLFNATKIEIHYYLESGSHLMDANIRHKCEGAMLEMIKELSVVLDIEIKVETEAYGEGGLKELFHFEYTQKNTFLIGTALTLFGFYLTRHPVSTTPELDALNLEIARNTWTDIKAKQATYNESKINIDSIVSSNKILTEKNKDLEVKNKNLFEENKNLELKAELIQYNKIENKPLETIHKINLGTLNSNENEIEKLLPLIESSIKSKRYKSNFYKTLLKYPKVESISTGLLNKINSPVSTPINVLRNDFEAYIVDKIKLPVETLENVKIYIISPVITGGDYKWTGKYDGETIEFTVIDKDFKKIVANREISFVNGFQIECTIQIWKIIDDYGNIKITNTNVITVIGYSIGDIKIETEKGKQIRIKKENDVNQIKLNLDS